MKNKKYIIRRIIFVLLITVVLFLVLKKTVLKNVGKDKDSKDLGKTKLETDLKKDEVKEPEPEPEPIYIAEKSEPVDMSYFDDAIFIGDSRTQALEISTDMDNTTFYSSKGLLVDGVFSKPVININGQNMTIIDAMKNSKYSKVYVMLVINETGWPETSIFIEKYRKLVTHLKEINPESIIYIQSVLPVSENVSNNHEYLKNSKIKEYNDGLKALAKEEGVYYVDIAGDLFKEGVLPAEAATDGIHLKREYCEEWLNYLRSHTVRKE